MASGFREADVGYGCSWYQDLVFLESSLGVRFGGMEVGSKLSFDLVFLGLVRVLNQFDLPGVRFGIESCLIVSVAACGFRMLVILLNGS
ncbi:hypothetical protein Droror1_Dr00020539, partial [Drosera rotundifolia]